MSFYQGKIFLKKNIYRLNLGLMRLVEKVKGSLALGH